MWVFTDEKKTLKKKDVMYLLSYIKEYLQRSLYLLKNKSRISLVKLVVTIISVIVSSKKGNHFLKSLLLAFANTCEILSLLSELTVFPNKLRFADNGFMLPVCPYLGLKGNLHFNKKITLNHRK